MWSHKSTRSKVQCRRVLPPYRSGLVRLPYILMNQRNTIRGGWGWWRTWWQYQIGERRTEMLIWKGRKWRIFSISRGGSSWRLTRKGITLTKSQGTNMVVELCYFLSKNENYITWHVWTCKHRRTVHINFTKALHGIFEINILLQVTYFDGTWSIPTCEQLICIWQLTLLSSIKNICPGREVKSRVNNNGSQLPRPDTIISFRIYIMRKKKKT